MKKTILALSYHVNNWGAEKSFCAVINRLNQKGFHVVVLISKHGDIEQTLQLYHIEYYVIPLATSLIMGKWNNGTIWKIRYLYMHIVCFVKFTIKLEKLLKKNKIKPDIVYTNTIIPATGIYLSLRFGIPHIIHIREITDEDFPVMYYIGRKNYLSLLKKTLGYAICISNAVKTKFEPYLGDKCRLIYNGLPISKANLQKKVKTHNIKHILFVGRLSCEKGPMTCLQAIEKLVKGNCLNFIFDIWGSGPDESQIKAFVEERKLSQYVILHGYGTNISYEEYDIAIMSSPHEAFGRVTVEYMLAGLPVIGCNGGATPEIIKSEETGLLYNNVNDLCYSIKRLLTDDDLCNRLGRSAKKRAEKLFAEERCLREVCELFDSLNI